MTKETAARQDDALSHGENRFSGRGSRKGVVNRREKGLQSFMHKNGLGGGGEKATSPWWRIRQDVGVKRMQTIGKNLPQPTCEEQGKSS